MPLLRYPTPFGMIVLDLKIDERRLPQHGRYIFAAGLVTEGFVAGMQAAVEGKPFVGETEARAAGWTFASNILAAARQEPPADLAAANQKPPADLAGANQKPPTDLAGANQKPPTDLAAANQEPPADLAAAKQEPASLLKHDIADL